MNLLIMFIVLSIVNVILQTVKSICTVKCGKGVAALVNAIAFGLYTVVIVYTNADFIATQLLPPKADGSTEDQRIKLKSKIVKDLLPSIDWNKYEAMIDDVKKDIERESCNG